MGRGERTVTAGRKKPFLANSGTVSSSRSSSSSSRTWIHWQCRCPIFSLCASLAKEALQRSVINAQSLVPGYLFTLW